MAKLKIGIATCDKFPNLAADDLLFFEELQKQGTHPVPAIWNDRSVNWKEFDGVVIRSCWDYHHKPADFLNWLQQMETELVRIWNPVPVLRGNMRKTYLKALQEKGFATVPTVFLERGSGTKISELLKKRNWTSAVVKPDISASSFRTRLVSQEHADAEEHYFEELLRDSGVMVQPFLEEVAELGEWSFIFIDGRFSHAALKRPKAGDFRVQDDFGGSQTLTTPSSSLLHAATRFAETIPKPWLYARIDGVQLNETFTLMELELIEPSLFLALEPPSAERFARAALRKIAG